MMLKEPVIRYLENQKDPKYVDSSWNIDVLFTRQQSKSEMLNGNDLKHHLQEDRYIILKTFHTKSFNRFQDGKK